MSTTTTTGRLLVTVYGHTIHFYLSRVVVEPSIATVQDLSIGQVIVEFLAQSGTHLHQRLIRLIRLRPDENMKFSGMKWLNYFSIEETVEESDKESLERGEKVGRVGPDCKLFGRSVQRGRYHNDSVRDTQEREQNERRFEGFSYLFGFAALAVAQFSYEYPQNVEQVQQINLSIGGGQFNVQQFILIANELASKNGAVVLFFLLLF